MAERSKKAGKTGRGDGRAHKAHEIGHEHEANVNQVRHEPIPASHHDDRREAAVREEERSPGKPPES
jgi:hypothetical protein